MTKQELLLHPIQDLQETEGGFSYGSANAMIVEEREKGNKNIKAMIRRTREINNVLGLPFVIPEVPSAISHDNGNAYARADIGDTTFYVMTRTPIDGKSLQEIVGERQPELHIVSGPCLFSANSVAIISRNGNEYAITRPGVEVDEKTEKLVINPQLSLYEAESIVRLSTFIAAIGSGETPVKSIRLNIPRVEYYNYVLNAYGNGHFTSEQLHEWFAAVDGRNARLSNLMEKNITRRLTTNKTPDFIISEPLAPLEEYIKQSVTDYYIPSIDTAKNMLFNSSQIWRDVLAVEEPQSWIEINNLSYVVAELQTAYVPKTNSDIAHIGIAIENPTEGKIFGHTRKIAAALPKDKIFNLIGIFPHELVVPVGDNARRTMYHVEEQDAHRGIQQARVIFEAYRK